MKRFLTMALLFVFSCIAFTFAQKEAPPPVAAALTLKLAGFDNKLSGSVKIFVVGNDAIAAELKKAVGKPIGKGTLAAVDAGADVPSAKYNIIVCGAAGKAGAVSKYAKSNKALSVTSIPSAVSKGITLGMGVGDDGKPRIMLNLTSSGDEDIDWNPAIMKVAETIK